MPARAERPLEIKTHWFHGLKTTIEEMDRKENIQKQRAIVDQMIALFKEISDLNRLVGKHDKTDMMLLIGQHRHEFEDQLVADHSQCVTSQCITGSLIGNAGGLAMLADRDLIARQMIIQVHDYLMQKHG